MNFKAIANLLDRAATVLAAPGVDPVMDKLAEKVVQKIGKDVWRADWWKTAQDIFKQSTGYDASDDELYQLVQLAEEKAQHSGYSWRSTKIPPGVSPEEKKIFSALKTFLEANDLSYSVTFQERNKWMAGHKSCQQHDGFVATLVIDGSNLYRALNYGWSAGVNDDGTKYKSSRELIDELTTLLDAMGYYFTDESHGVVLHIYPNEANS